MTALDKECPRCHGKGIAPVAQQSVQQTPSQPTVPSQNFVDPFDDIVPPKPSSQPLAIAGAICTVVIVGLIAYFSVQWLEQPRSMSSIGVSRGILAPQAKYTMSQFVQMQDGISYEKAVKIMGDPGVKLSENNMAGFYTVVYMWQNEDGSNMNALFQNNQLKNKAQARLPD